MGGEIRTGFESPRQLSWSSDSFFHSEVKAWALTKASELAEETGIQIKGDYLAYKKIATKKLES